MSVKQCSKCSVSFECTNETRGCWCEQVIVPVEMLKHLKDSYANCLCPKCLNEFSGVNYPLKK